MNYTEEQLRELELWPLVSLQMGPNVLAVQRVAAPGMLSPAEQLPAREAVASAPSRTAARVSAPAATPVTTPVRQPARTPVAGLGTADWKQLKAQVSNCQACGLCSARKQAVFGVGVETGPWLFVGEGPGAEEDEQGEPFVGQAGKLLDAMLASIQLSRNSNAYIANVVKCRPPGNRTPTPDEASACAEYLDRQIDLVSPRLIVALGKTAATRLVNPDGPDASLASMRGKLHRYRDYPVLVTYHPAYLLRNLVDKAKAWEDLVNARRIFAEQTASAKPA